MAREEGEVDIDWEDGVDVRWIQNKREIQSAPDEPPVVGPWVWHFFAALVGVLMAFVALGILWLGWWR